MSNAQTFITTTASSSNFKMLWDHVRKTKPITLLQKLDRDVEQVCQRAR